MTHRNLRQFQSLILDVNAQLTVEFAVLRCPNSPQSNGWCHRISISLFKLAYFSGVSSREIQTALHGSISVRRKQRQMYEFEREAKVRSSTRAVVAVRLPLFLQRRYRRYCLTRSRAHTISREMSGRTEERNWKVVGESAQPGTRHVACSVSERGDSHEQTSFTLLLYVIPRHSTFTCHRVSYARAVPGSIHAEQPFSLSPDLWVWP